MRQSSDGRDNPDTWPCGHERTPANTQSVGVNNGARCKACRKAICARSKARNAVPVTLQVRAVYIPHSGKAVHRGRP